MENSKISQQYSENKGLNLVPRAVVVIGDVATIPTSFNLLTNNSFESDTLTLTIPMDLIDMSEIIQKTNQDNQFFIVELWVGYLDSTKQHTWNQSYTDRLKSNIELKKDLIDNYKDLLYKRWVGVLKQFEMEYSTVESADLVRLTCSDYSSILNEKEIEAVFKDDESKLENVVNKINGELKSFKFVIDDKVPANTKNLLLGYSKDIKIDDKDGGESKEQKEIKYVVQGKTYWSVMMDIANKGYLKIIPDYQQSDNQKITYKLATRTSSNKAWILEREKHFNSLTIRNGKIGNGSPTKIAIEILSAQEDNSIISGSFPTDISSSEFPIGSFYKKIHGAPRQTKKQLELRAKEIAIQYAKFDMTGDLQCPNAMLGINPNDVLILKDSSSLLKGRRISSLAGDIEKPSKDEETQDAKNFLIKSITEDFDGSNDGYTQKIEFELNMALNAIDLKSGELRGKNLFPSTKKDEKVSNFFKKPKSEELPTPLRRIREQWGL